MSAEQGDVSFSASDCEETIRRGLIGKHEGGHVVETGDLMPDCPGCDALVALDALLARMRELEKTS